MEMIHLIRRKRCFFHCDQWNPLGDDFSICFFSNVECNLSACIVTIYRNGTRRIQRTATDYNGPQRTAADYNGLQRTTADRNGPRRTITDRNGPQGTATDDNGAQRTTTDRNGLGLWSVAVRCCKQSYHSLCVSCCTARKTSIVVFYINRVIDGSLLLLFATVVATLAETVAAAVATCM